MASAMKRKRGPVEVSDPRSPSPPKRARSVEIANGKIGEAAPLFDSSKVGWDAAFGAAKKAHELVETELVKDGSEEDEGEDFEAFLKEGKKEKAKERRKRRKEREEDLPTPWKTSDAIGGRMLDIDPVFTKDEKFLIVAHRRSIKVYSTANSLLNRTIHLADKQILLGQIVAYELSPNEPNKIWVACNNGRIFNIDWTTGNILMWVTMIRSVSQMTAGSIKLSGKARDIIFTISEVDGAWKILAHELAFVESSYTSQSRILYSSTQPFQILKAVGEGIVIVAASGKNVLVGALKSSEVEKVDEMRCEMLIFESAEVIASLDARVTKRSSVKEILLGRKKVSKAELNVVDVVVGDVKGQIFVHHDLIGNFRRSQMKLPNQELASSIIPINLKPRKLHWHRKMVSAVKWSLDGNYIISGGSETTLVLWQLDTSYQQYLPHLSAAIINLVISPSGTSYAVHLADNSTMVLSTSELIPTANIAGFQSHVLQSSTPIDSCVRRLIDSARSQPLVPRTLAVVNPANPSRLMLAVGENQCLDPQFTGQFNTQYLQTYDITSNHNVSRQALTRTNVTNLNISPNALPVSQPTVTHMQISKDGMWLATVDEWAPPKRDVESLGYSMSNMDAEQQRRREVYLKFWLWQKSDETWALVNRIDSPHASSGDTHGTGPVLAITTDPSSHAFSTIGEDGMVLIWRPRTRKRDGVVVRGPNGEPVTTWSCQRRISLGSTELRTDTFSSPARPEHASLAFSEDGSILAAAINGGEDCVVHLLDPLTGSIRLSRPITYQGDLIVMAFLGQYLIVLADDLRVYDLVLDEMRYGIELSEAKHRLSLEQKAAMMHLAVDTKSGTFAVALPCLEGPALADEETFYPLANAHSEIAIFCPQSPNPVHVHGSETLVTSIIPAISSSGFILVDAAAEIISLSPKAIQTLVSMSKPMVELKLDLRNEQASLKDLSDIDDAEQMEIDEKQETLELAAEFAVQDDEDDGPPVVSQQQLARIFDVGPAFALPPIEDMFYQVADLFSSKPLAQGA